MKIIKEILKLIREVDKKNHFWITFFVNTGLFFILSYYFYNDFIALIISFCTVNVGMYYIKEVIFDKILKRGCYDERDVKANLLGSGFSSSILFILMILKIFIK